MRHVKLPAQTIWGIVTVAGDPTIPLAYIQRFNTRYQEFAAPDNGAKYIERIIPADEVIHWKLNAEEDEIRGRSETYAALPWHLKYRNHWEAQIEKDYATAAYAYVAFVEGNDAQVRQFVAQHVPHHRPKPGHTRVFNSKVKSFEVVESDKNSPSGPGSTSEGILNALSANYGFAKEYFGVDGNRTRGGAVTSAGPAEKSFEDRQDDFGEVVRQCYQDAIDAAVAFGIIPQGDANGNAADLSFTVNFPEIIKADSQTKVLLLAVGRAQGALSLKTFAQQWANSVDLGHDYDYEAEMAQIAVEKAAGIGLPPMPKNFDPIDAPTPPGDGSDVPDPRSANGQQQIRRDDLSPEVEAYMRERGAIVVYP
ncbi:MAG: hypothetical protein IAI48_00445 [Candidatus Eremiobacteraeota bacterium]|nr:hypothetical protein [Candidatus Eremiobacteraeota bacterium]